jgi:hypothetical protein
MRVLVTLKVSRAIEAGVMPSDSDSEMKIRPFCEMEDLGDDFTAELREWHDRMNAHVEQR